MSPPGLRELLASLSQQVALLEVWRDWYGRELPPEHGGRAGWELQRQDILATAVRAQSQADNGLAGEAERIVEALRALGPEQVEGRKARTS